MAGLVYGWIGLWLDWVMAGLGQGGVLYHR